VLLFCACMCINIYTLLSICTLLNVTPGHVEPPVQRQPVGVLPPWYEADHRVRRQHLSAWRSDEVARDIDLHQNPSNCTSKPFMLLKHAPSGLGSMVHIATAFLALAFERDHILLYASDFAAGWTGGPYCAGKHSLECFFQPLSRCAPAGRLPPGATSYVVGFNEDVVNKIPKRWHDAFQSDAAARSELPGADQDVGVKYWWRAQAAAYLVRLNGATSDHLKLQRRRLAEQGAVPLPLPPDTFSCHVRHSDKSREMRLFDFATYAAAVQRTAEALQILNPHVFVSTEDPRVVDDARMTFGARALVVAYNRTNPQSLSAHMAGGAKETLHSMMKIQMRSSPRTLWASWARIGTGCLMSCATCGAARRTPAAARASWRWGAASRCAALTRSTGDGMSALSASGTPDGEPKCDDAGCKRLRSRL
jgi:hypothetical protein